MNQLKVKWNSNNVLLFENDILMSLKLEELFDEKERMCPMKEKIEKEIEIFEIVNEIS